MVAGTRGHPDRRARAGGPKPGAAILDVGCGNALSFAALAEFGTVRGIEVDASLLDDTAPFRRADLDRAPGLSRYMMILAGGFDVITALDVLEHIDDDRHALASMSAMLDPGGLMVITVPAFEMLWDHHDEINHHRRRYTARRPEASLAGCGVDVIELRYLFRALFVPKLLVRLWNTGRTRKIAKHAIPRPTDRSRA